MEDAYAQEESTKDQLSKMNGGEKEPDGAVGGAAGIMATTTQLLFPPGHPPLPDRSFGPGIMVSDSWLLLVESTSLLSQQIKKESEMNNLL